MTLTLLFLLYQRQEPEQPGNDKDSPVDLTVTSPVTMTTAMLTAMTTAPVVDLTTTKGTTEAETEEDMLCKSDQLLAYSDFVSFMTQVIEMILTSGHTI